MHTAQSTPIRIAIRHRPSGQPYMHTDMSESSSSITHDNISTAISCGNPLRCSSNSSGALPTNAQPARQTCEVSRRHHMNMNMNMNMRGMSGTSTLPAGHHPTYLWAMCAPSGVHRPCAENSALPAGHCPPNGSSPSRAFRGALACGPRAQASQGGRGVVSSATVSGRIEEHWLHGERQVVGRLVGRLVLPPRCACRRSFGGLLGARRASSRHGAP